MADLLLQIIIVFLVEFQLHHLNILELRSLTNGELGLPIRPDDQPCAQPILNSKNYLLAFALINPVQTFDDNRSKILEIVIEPLL